MRLQIAKKGAKKVTSHSMGNEVLKSLRMRTYNMPM